MRRQSTWTKALQALQDYRREIPHRMFRPDRTVPGTGALLSSAAQAPLLVRSACAAPQLDLRAVGGCLAGGVEAQPRLHAGDRAVGVDVPLLVRLAVAVPDHRRGAVGGSLAGGVKALVAVHHELL